MRGVRHPANAARAIHFSAVHDMHQGVQRKGGGRKLLGSLAGEDVCESGTSHAHSLQAASSVGTGCFFALNYMAGGAGGRG